MAELLYSQNQSIMLTNVLSANYNIKPEGIPFVLQDMIDTAVGAGYTPKKNPFYSFPHFEELEDGTYNITVYLPVYEDYKGNMADMPNTAYNSYFLVPRMYGVRVIGGEAVDFDLALNLLSELLNIMEVEQSSPVFYIPVKINEQLYTDILVGVKLA